MRFGTVILAAACLASGHAQAQATMPPFTCERPAWPDCLFDLEMLDGACISRLESVHDENYEYRVCVHQYSGRVMAALQDLILDLHEEEVAAKLLNDCRVAFDNLPDMRRCPIPDFMRD